MAEIKDLSTTDANNTGTAANAGFPENMAYSDVNNAARALEGMIARHFADSNGTLTTTGSSNAYLLTPNRTVAAYTAGDAYMIKASFTNTGAVTINVSSLGAKSIVKPSGDALAAGELNSGGIYAIIFDGTNFQMAGADDPENLTLTSLTVTGTTALNGNTTIGDAASDTVTITADVASDLIPSADGTHDLGAVGSEWQDLFIDGTANIDSLVADTADIDAGTIDGTVIGGSTAAAVTGTTITANTSLNIAGDGATVTGIKDEDDMASDSATKLATQQSIKAYVDSQVTAQDLDFQADSGGALSVDLDSQTFTLTGGTGIDTSGSGQTVTFDIDSTVATLTGSQTLTNKTLTSPVLNTGVSGTAILDEDNMASNSATQLATQQSIKTYVDNQLTSEDLDFQADSGGALSVDLDSQTFTLTGGTGIDTVGANQTVTFAIDSTVATLTGTQTLTNKTLTSPVLNTSVSGTAVLDEDNMASDSDTQLATQQSIKAYVDAQITAEDLDFQADSGGALSIDLDSETLTFTGGTGIDTSGSGNAVTFAIDSTVATLTGSQTLTNKTLTSPDINTPDIDGGTIDNTVIGGSTPAAGSFTTGSFSGNVGIGATSINRKLEIAGNNNGGAKANYIRITDTDTTATAGNQQGGIEFYTNDVTPGISASIEVLYAGSGGGGEITFNTNSSSSGTLTEAMRIDENSNVTYSGDLVSSTSGTSNFRAGVNAGDSIASGGNFNTVVGDEAGTAITTGDGHTLIGYAAGDAITTATTGLTAVGNGALGANTSGTDNAAFGEGALADLTEGVGNIAIGRFAGGDIIDADGNVAIGGYDGSAQPAMRLNTKSHNNIAIGSGALSTLNHTTATDAYNVAVGHLAGNDITTGVQNTLVGALAGDSLTDADFNVAVGVGALDADTLGSRNTAIGYAALTDQNFTTATNSYNVAVGFYAGTDVTTATHNTLIGALAGDALTTGGSNVAVGYNSLSTEDGHGGNVAVGTNVLAAQNAGATGYNTAVGHNAGLSVTTGVQNTIVGGLAGDALTEGDANVLIGYRAATHDVNLQTGSRVVVIGAFADTSTTGATDANVIGYNVSGAGGFTTLGSGSSDIRAANGTATWAAVSDERYKKDITDSTLGLSFINALKPRTFNYKTLGELPETFKAYEEGSSEVYKSEQTQHGFIAQEVKTAIDAASGVADGFKMWAERDDGSQEVAEAALIPMLVKAIQELSAEIETLKSGG